MEPISNSVTVYIRRLPQFAVAARKELEEYFNEGQRGYGAYFAKGSARIATGLTIPEEDLLLPLILNIPKEDRDFRVKVTNHYETLDVKVPGRDGLKLEIGLSRSNTEPVAADNMPIMLEDYLKYRHALQHPWIAPSAEEGKGNQLKQYYIFNVSEVSKANTGINEMRDKAIGYYLTLKEDKRKVDMFLTLLGVRTENLTVSDKVIRLRNLADTDPAKFIATYDDRDKEIKYTIEDMINRKILERVKNSILIKDDGTVIGHTMKEAIVFMQSSHNTKIYNTLRVRLQESWKLTSSSVDTDADLDLPKTPTEPVAPPVVETPEDLEPAKELMPAQPEPEVALVEGSASDIDD